MIDTDRLRAEPTLYLVYGLAVLFVAAALVGPLLLDDTANDGLWISLLVGGALVMVAGALLEPRRASAVLISIGAVAGGLPLFGTIVVPFLVAAVIATTISRARRAAAQA